MIVRTLAVLGCNFDCASREEIRLVKDIAKDLPRQPDIIYANPSKARAHLLEAVCKGIRMVTFDNAEEIKKCAAISKHIQLILRIVTDDRGSQCRLSSKFGAPRAKWRPLLATAKKYGLDVIGVSFHVGSGCRDGTRYELALKDAREIFDMAKKDFGFDMSVLDIGGGFPGETHSLWNPQEEIDEEPESLKKEGIEHGSDDGESEGSERFMYFKEIAEYVSPIIDDLFPEESGVRVIGEPGRFFVAACSTLCCNVIAMRTNECDGSFELEAFDDREHAQRLSEMTREEESELVNGPKNRMDRTIRNLSLGGGAEAETVLETMVEELQSYSRLYARQNLSQQEADAYNDVIDFYEEGFETAADILGAPTEAQTKNMNHTVEGMNYPLVAMDKDVEDTDALITLAAAGEAAINGIVMQAVADSGPLQDDIAYTINNSVYSAFNNIMFDHATVRPRVLRERNGKVFASKTVEGFLEFDEDTIPEVLPVNQQLYTSTVFGNTCDSIDVVARSVLLPKLEVGDWLYFQNMGAYTMAASSNFNGFQPSEKFYVCSVQPEYFEALIAGPDAEECEEEKKDSD